jgi:hypothetical protein
MPAPPKSKKIFINELQFTDEHVWIAGIVTSHGEDAINIDDGTGSIQIPLSGDPDAPAEDEYEAPAKKGVVIKGSLVEGAFVRVIGDIVSRTDKTFSIVPLIIQNLDELGVNRDQFNKLRSLEQNIIGDA